MRSRFDYPEWYNGDSVASLPVSRATWTRHRGLMCESNVFLYYSLGGRMRCDLAPVAQCSAPDQWALELRRTKGAEMKVIVGGWLKPSEMNFCFGLWAEAIVRDAVRKVYSEGPDLWDKYLDARVVIPGHPSQISLGTVREIASVSDQRSLL